MNMTHLIWMTLPPGDVSGRGEHISRVAAKHGLKAESVVALTVDTGHVLPTQTSATLADALASLDEGVGGGNVGWRASAGEASVVIGPVTLGERRGLVLRFTQDDFYELASAVKGGGLLELIAALHDTCEGREVIWARDASAEAMMEILDGDPSDFPVGILDDVAAVAEVNEDLFELMEIFGAETWSGNLRFVAQGWARPNG
jgi:hypothetical protein